jgi:hypothetical protein
VFPVRYELNSCMLLKNIVLRDVKSCRLVDVYRIFQ